MSRYRVVRTLAFAALGYAMPDMLQGNWKRAALSLFASCVLFVLTIYSGAGVPRSEGHER